MEKKSNTEEWQQKLKAWKSSGKSRSEFCREHRIAVSTFDYWKKRLNSGDGGTKFIKLPALMDSGRNAAPLSIVVDGRYRVELRAGFDPDDLAIALRTIGSVSCS